MAKQQPLSLTEHLAELRRRLIISLVAVVIGMGAAWNFSTDMLSFIEKPLTGKTYLTELKKLVYDEVKVQYPEIYTHYQLDKETAIPVKARMLNYTAPLEPFFVQCKISMLAGFVLALPMVFFQLWQFIAPGLTKKEKRMAVPFVTASFLSFCIGATFF
ncbi:MAG: twin-arginine translocase subunit TatC, partial [Desulfurivibrionaceae bacterium]